MTWDRVERARQSARNRSPDRKYKQAQREGGRREREEPSPSHGGGGGGGGGKDSTSVKETNAMRIQAGLKATRTESAVIMRGFSWDHLSSNVSSCSRANGW